MAANWYVRSGASGTASGADWTNAKLTLAAAATASAAGDTIYVSEDHAESTAGTVTITMPGTAASPTRIFCVNHLGSVPPVSIDLATTATVSVGASASTLSVNGNGYIYGIKFQGGTSNSSSCTVVFCQTAGNRIYLKNCQTITRSIAVTTFVGCGGTSLSGELTCDGVTFKFGAAVNFGILLNGRMIMKNCSVDGTGSVPASLIAVRSTNLPFLLEIDGCDLSAVSSGTLITHAASCPAVVTLKDTKIHASATISSTPSNLCVGTTDVIRSDSGNTNYKIARFAYTGTLTTETTIVRTGGATDGVTPIAYKIVTTANSGLSQPFEAQILRYWNNTVNQQITVTVYGIWGGGAVPTDADMWIDVEYLGSSTFPTGSFATSGKADLLATNNNTSSDTSTWGGSTTAFKMTASFTPQQKGPVDIRVKVAATTTTVYIDPKPLITGTTIGTTITKSYVDVGGYTNEIAAGPAMLVNSAGLIG